MRQLEWRNGTWWDGGLPITTDREMQQLGLDPAGPDGRGKEIDENATFPGEKWGRNIMYLTGERGRVPRSFRYIGCERWGQEDGEEVQILRIYHAYRTVKIIGDSRVYIDGKHIETRDPSDPWLCVEVVARFVPPRKGEYAVLDWPGRLHLPGGTVFFRSLRNRYSRAGEKIVNWFN